MSTRAFFSLALLSTAAFFVTSSPRTAEACQPTPCEPARLAPPSLAAVPLNAPAFPYIAPSGAGTSSTTFRLLNPGNVEIATTSTSDPWWPFGGQLLIPSAALAVGAGYEVSYLETCTFTAAPEQGERKFDVVGSVALPTASGPLRGGNWKVETRNVPTSSGACTAPVEAVWIDLVLAAPPELAAFAPVTGYKVVVDGQLARNVYYGAAKTAGSDIVVATLHATCGARDPQNDNGLTLGVHQVEVTSHVAGATADPSPAVAMLNFSCTSEVTDGGTPDAARDASSRDDAATGADASPPADAAADAGVSGGDGTATAGCACDVAPGRGGPVGHALAGLAAVAAAFVARARRRRG